MKTGMAYTIEYNILGESIFKIKDFTMALKESRIYLSSSASSA